MIAVSGCLTASQPDSDGRSHHARLRSHKLVTPTASTQDSRARAGKKNMDFGNWALPYPSHVTSIRSGLAGGEGRRKEDEGI